MKPLGIYIHIPFCDGKCNYCDFFSAKKSSAEISEYCDALCLQLKEFGRGIGRAYTVDTVYFGGGTPSLIGTESLINILNSVKSSFNTELREVTLEANPTSGEQLDYRRLRTAGFNRLSIGMQSANQNELALLGRRHSAADAERTAAAARNGGFENISLDIMLAIPEQSAQSLLNTIDFALKQQVQHISAYLLKLEEGTPFFRNKGDYNFCDDETACELYKLLCSRLSESGFEHYEISNFCKPDFESRHNLKYWRLQEYLGLGPSAHSFMGGKRFFYRRSYDDFRKGIFTADGSGGDFEEYLILGLRLSGGVSFSELESRYGVKMPRAALDKIKLYSDYGLMRTGSAGFALTEEGFLVSNEIIAELLSLF